MGSEIGVEGMGLWGLLDAARQEGAVCCQAGLSGSHSEQTAWPPCWPRTIWAQSKHTIPNCFLQSIESYLFISLCRKWQKYRIITHTWGKTDWLKNTSFPGTENQRDVPQLALPFSSFDLGGLLPPLLSVHSKSRKEGIIFLWMQHGWTTTENHKTEIRSLSCVFGKPWHCLFAILTSLFPTAAPLVWMELHTQKHEFRLHFFLSVPTKEMSTFSKLR